MNDLGKIGDQVPLVVDVDGTLLRTDILHEQFLQFVATRPLESWRLIGWTMAGKAQLKSTLATNVDGNLDTVPLADEVLALIETAKKEGRPVYLASASDRRHVDELARRIGGVAGVFASDGRLNLSGEAKAGAADRRPPPRRRQPLEAGTGRARGDSEKVRRPEDGQAAHAHRERHRRAGIHGRRLHRRGRQRRDCVA